MIDLKQFCADADAEPWRADISVPFSCGGFTYATNGRLAIRVAAVSEVLEANDTQAPKVETLCKAFEGASSQTVTPFAGRLPTPLPMIECDECNGEGKPDHDCPTCECSCEECDGLGKVSQRRRIRFDGFDIDEKYLRMLASLPSLAIGAPPTEKDPVLFHFDGGIGLIMPMRSSVVFEGETILMASDLPAPVEHAEQSG